MLEIRSLSVRRDGRVLVDGLALSVRAGEFVAVAGPNGAGKSSLVRAISGEWPCTGEVEIDGRALQQWPRRRLARQMAVLPQQATLAFDFLVDEVVAMGRLPHHGDRSADHARRLDEAIARTGLQALRSRRYLSLSGGERQRVQFARVLAQLAYDVDPPPRLLLLDEPTSALDLAQQQSVLDACRALCADGVAVVAVLHDLNLAARYADRILLMRDGQRVALGPPAELLQASVLRDVFGCELIVGTADDDNQPYVLVRAAAAQRTR